MSWHCSCITAVWVGIAGVNPTVAHVATVGCFFSRTTFGEKIELALEKVELAFRETVLHDLKSFSSVLFSFGTFGSFCLWNYFLFFWKCYLVRFQKYLKGYLVSPLLRTQLYEALAATGGPDQVYRGLDEQLVEKILWYKFVYRFLWPRQACSQILRKIVWFLNDDFFCTKKNLQQRCEISL